MGDSLTVGTEPWLGADLGRLGWSMTGVDARVGRGVAEGLAVLRLRAASLPPTVVVALGTNDYGDDPTVVVSWLRSVRAVAGGRRVVWVNLCPDDAIAPRLAPYRRINAALTRDGPAFGVQVADWCAFAGRNGLTPGPDGVHYRSAAYQQRAAFYADLVAGITP
ncbi:MAG TPA: hypothetical protein VFH45_09695 [Acidimicrobiales bacterium]|nr:hypothetical protein [Acidimicrobiales bacterium]